MSDSTRPTFRQGQRLPGVRLQAVDRRPFTFTGGRGPLVLLAFHDETCQGCDEYSAGLARRTDELADWGARLVVIVPDLERSHPTLRSKAAGSITFVGDPEGVFVSVDRDSCASLLIADEWGEIHFAHRSADATGLPTVDEVIEWVRFVAIQCPECEQPEGAWRTM